MRAISTAAFRDGYCRVVRSRQRNRRQARKDADEIAHDAPLQVRGSVDTYRSSRGTGFRCHTDGSPVTTIRSTNAK